jgi:carbon monoxide dehydrogenase subunit G
MLSIKSNTVQIEKSKEVIFEFLCDLRNIEYLLPDRATNFSGSPETAEFDIQGLSRISMLLKDKKPSEQITIVNKENTSPVFTMNAKIEASESNCSLTFYFDVEISMAIKFLVEKPLTNMMNIFCEKTKEKLESK